MDEGKRGRRRPRRRRRLRGPASPGSPVGYRFAPRFSPDSKKLAFTDQTLTLFYLDIDTKPVTRVDKAEHEALDLAIDAKPIFDHAWSPDGRFLTYTKMGSDLGKRVFVYSLETKEARPVTAGPLDAFGPVF